MLGRILCCCCARENEDSELIVKAGADGAVALEGAAGGSGKAKVEKSAGSYKQEEETVKLRKEELKEQVKLFIKEGLRGFQVVTTSFDRYPAGVPAVFTLKKNLKSAVLVPVDPMIDQIIQIDLQHFRGPLRMTTIDAAPFAVNIQGVFVGFADERKQHTMWACLHVLVAMAKKSSAAAA